MRFILLFACTASFTFVFFYFIPLSYIKQKSKLNILLILAVVNALLILTIVQKVKQKLRLFSRGMRVPGLIKRAFKENSELGNIWFVECSYSYTGKEYTIEEPTYVEWKPGQKVTVILDPENPQKALIKNLYED